MNIEEQRKKIIKDCLKEVENKTPYHHIGRKLGVGVDCIGFIIEILKLNNFYQGGDIESYSRIPDGINLEKVLNQYLVKITFEEIKSGDIMLFTYFENPQHVAFYHDRSNIDYMIHSYGESSVNKVIENRLDTKWKNRLHSVYRIKEFCE